MNLKKANILGSCVLILLCGGMATQVMAIKTGIMVDILGPRFFPGSVLALIAALSLLAIGITVRSKEGQDELFASKAGMIHTVMTLLIFSMYLIGLHFIGYAVSTVLFLFVLAAYYYGKMDKKLTGIAIYSIMSSIIIFLLFTYVFNIRLPRGVF